MDEQTKEIRIKRLKYRSCYRGSREMDIFLKAYAEKFLAGFSDSELDLYEKFIKEDDQYIYNWITGKEPLPEDLDNKISHSILNFKL